MQEDSVISRRKLWHHLLNGGSLLASKVVIYAISLFAIPIFVKYHGEGAYGILAFFGTLLGYSILIENGLSYAVTLRFTRCLARQELNESIVVARSALPIYVFLGLLCIIAFTIIGDNLSTFIWKKADYGYAIKVVGATIGVLVFDAFSASLIQAYNRLVALNVIRLLADSIRISSLYIAAFSNDPIVVMVWMFLASAIFKLVLDWLYCIFVIKIKEVYKPRLDFAELISNLKLAPSAFVICGLWLMISMYDKTFAASRVSEAQYAYYALAADLTTKAHILFYAVSGTTYNMMIRRHASNQNIGGVLKIYFVALAVIFAIYYLPLFIFAKQIIAYFLGVDPTGQAVPVIRLLTACSLMYLAFASLEATLNAQGRSLQMMFVYITAAILLPIATPFFFGRFGLVGVSLGLVIMFFTMLFLTLGLSLAYGSRMEKS